MNRGGVFDRFFDDAAIFPPGNAPLDVAVKQHLARRGTADSRYVGPFVVDEARLADLEALLEAPLDVTLVRSPAAGGTSHAAEPRRGRDERREGVGEAEGPLVHVVSTEGPPGATAVEKAWGTGFEVPEGAILKLRCGGDYVPTVAELAAAIRWCVEHDQQFKLTAGLHAAIATEDAHGFVNVMAAVVAATRGEDPGPLLMAWADEIDMSTLAESRRLLRSIGTCDIDQPLSDLRALGLIP